MRLSSIYLLLILPIASSPLLATDQISNPVTYDGKQLHTHGISIIPDSVDGKLPEVLAKGQWSTANWGGYVASWSIFGGKLYLDRVEQYLLTDEADPAKGREWRELPLERVRPGRISPTVADWHTGMIRGGMGRVLEHDTSYGRCFEREFVFRVVKGKVEQIVEVRPGNADPFQSHHDLIWRALGTPKRDAGDWIDARLLNTSVTVADLAAGTPIKTRGLLWVGGPESVLHVPNSRKTRDLYFPLKRHPDFKRPWGFDDPVEVMGTLERVDGAVKLDVKSARPLMPGETIHAANYAEFHEKLKLGETPEFRR